MNKILQLKKLIEECKNDIFSEFVDDVYFIYLRCTNSCKINCDLEKCGKSYIKNLYLWLEENSDDKEESQFDIRYWIDDFEVLITDDEDLWV